MKDIKKIELILQLATEINDLKKSIKRWGKFAKRMKKSGLGYKIYSGYQKQGRKHLNLLEYAYALTLNEIK